MGAKPESIAELAAALAAGRLSSKALVAVIEGLTMLFVLAATVRRA